MFDSLRVQSQDNEFFHEIGEFKLLTEILSANSKSEAACTNVLRLISGLLGVNTALMISKKDIIKMFIESGGVEAINNVLSKQKEIRTVVELCMQILCVLPLDEGKSACILLLLLSILFFRTMNRRRGRKAWT